MSLTKSNVIALKKRSNTDKKKSKEESHVFMCVQCKYSHLVGEMLQPKNRLKRRMAFPLTSILCTGNLRTMRNMSFEIRALK